MKRHVNLWALTGIAILLAISLLALVSSAAHAEYVGSRWLDTDVCIQNKVTDPTIRQALANAAGDVREKTVLHVVNYGASDCKAAGYDQIIVAVDNWYGSSWHIASTTYTGGFDWAYTPNIRKATWMNQSPVTIKLNQSQTSLDASDWAHVASHELGHALGLSHVTRTCESVMTTRPDCQSGYTELAWWDYVGNVTYPGLDVIYSW